MQMLEYIIVKIFYEFLRRLPFRFSHILVTILFFFIYHIIGYRKKVIIENLREIFPEKDEESLNSLVSGIYKNFSMLLVEILQTWRLDKKFISKNFKIHNWEIMEEAIEKNL
jgi:KDO2-lipid IV(A) lauroyltransferase